MMFYNKSSHHCCRINTSRKEVIRNKLIEVDNLGNNINAKEKNLYTVLEVALECLQGD